MKTKVTFLKNPRFINIYDNRHGKNAKKTKTKKNFLFEGINIYYNNTYSDES